MMQHVEHVIPAPQQGQPPTCEWCRERPARHSGRIGKTRANLCTICCDKYAEDPRRL